MKEGLPGDTQVSLISGQFKQIIVELVVRDKLILQLIIHYVRCERIIALFTSSRHVAEPSRTVASVPRLRGSLQLDVWGGHLLTPRPENARLIRGDLDRVSHTEYLVRRYLRKLAVNSFAERASLMLTFSAVRVEPGGTLHRGSANIDAVADALVGDLTRLIAGRGVVPRVSEGMLYFRIRAHLIRFWSNLVEYLRTIDFLSCFLGRYVGRPAHLLRLHFPPPHPDVLRQPLEL